MRLCGHVVCRLPVFSMYVLRVSMCMMRGSTCEICSLSVSWRVVVMVIRPFLKYALDLYVSRADVCFRCICVRRGDRRTMYMCGVWKSNDDEYLSGVDAGS